MSEAVRLVTDAVMYTLCVISILYALALFFMIFGDREYTVMREADSGPWKAVRGKPIPAPPPTERLPAVRIVKPKSFW